MSTTPSPLIETERKNKRIQKIQSIAGNAVCADCPAEKPLWVSFLKDSEETKGTNLSVGGAFCVIICDSCATHHHFELGGELCSLKYMKYAHEWSDEELDCVEQSGNRMVNHCYEAGKMKFEKMEINYVKEEEDERRGKFIKSKYVKKKYLDAAILEKTLDKMFGRGKYSEEEGPKRGKEGDSAMMMTRGAPVRETVAGTENRGVGRVAGRGSRGEMTTRGAQVERVARGESPEGTMIRDDKTTT